MSLSPFRELVYRYLELPYVTRMSIARKLNLMEPGDLKKGEPDLWKAVLRRAKDNGALSVLSVEIKIASKELD